MSKVIYQELYTKAAKNPYSITMEDIYNLATVEPVVYNFLSLYGKDNFPLDKLLMGCVCVLAGQLAATRQALIEAYQTKGAP